MKVVAPFVSILLAACLQCFGLDPRATITQYAHIPWRVGERGLEAPPLSIAQTRDGYIWIGTRRQLYRFDGIQFVPLPDPETNIPHVQDTRFLFAANDGALYISSRSYGVFRWKDGSLQRIGDYKAYPVRSRKILQGLSGIPPADTTMITLYVKSFIVRSNALMRMRAAFTAPSPASCLSREVHAG